MARIRTIKPDFWDSPGLAALRLELVYDGPLPRGHRCYAENLPGVAPLAEYVYLLSRADGALVYVGRAWRVADRLSKHCRKGWWRQVDHIALVRVQGTTADEAARHTKLLEALAIRDLQPSGNIAGPSRKAMAQWPASSHAST